MTDTSLIDVLKAARDFYEGMIPGKCASYGANYCRRHMQPKGVCAEWGAMNDMIAAHIARLESPELVEKVARAICVAEEVDPDATGYAVSQKSLEKYGKRFKLWEYRVDRAKAAIAAMMEG